MSEHRDTTAGDAAGELVALVPLPELEPLVTHPPAGVRVVGFEGLEGPTTEECAQAHVYVPPYMRSGHRQRAWIEQMPQLQVMQSLTAGVDHLMPLLPEGVTLCNAAGVHDASTAELAVAMAVAGLRGFPEFAQAQQQGHWLGDYVGTSLADRRVLIVGAGRIAQAIERRLAPFECEWIKKVGRTARPAENVHAFTELSELVPQAEVVILIVPLTEQTQGLFDAHMLAQLSDGALLINVARGAVVDTEALVAELKTGRIRAAVDVTDPEPLPEGHPLWSAPGLLIAPHVGGNSTAFRPRAQQLVREQLTRLVAGEPLENVVTPL